MELAFHALNRMTFPLFYNVGKMVHYDVKSLTYTEAVRLSSEMIGMINTPFQENMHFYIAAWIIEFEA